MKKFNVMGKNKTKVALLKKRMSKLGFVLSSKPEFIVSYGGDGTFLCAERVYPGIPKLLSRESSICQKCGNMLLGHVLELVYKGKIKVKEYCKVEAVAGKKKFLATNDIIIRNSFPGHAIRFTVAIDGKKSDLMIGDGIVIASAFGSTGYFHSISGKSFSKGIGVAYNNVIGNPKHRVLQSSSKVTFQLVRGEAVVVADNNRDFVKLKGKGSVKIKASRKLIRIIVV